jgi:endonuclease/exonuclease/phosphatase family metal-dependent hydrolase
MLGLLYVPLLTANLIFTLFWLVLRKKYFLISAIVIIVGWNHIGDHFQIRIPDKKMIQGEALSITTFNIHAAGMSQFDELLSFIEKQHSDVYCLQEVYGARNFFLKHFRTDLSAYQLVFPKSRFSPDILVKHPVVHRGKLSFNQKTFAVYADIQTNKDTVRIYSVQLESFRLQDEKQLFDRNNPTESEQQIDWLKSMTGKFRRAYQNRTGQVNILSANMAECPYSAILAGDLNDTPMSFSYNKLSSNLRDAFKQRGSCVSNTYNENLPPIRIDYILHDKKLAASTYKKHIINISDHFPLSVTLYKNERNQ